MIGFWRNINKLLKKEYNLFVNLSNNVGNSSESKSYIGEKWKNCVLYKDKDS